MKIELRATERIRPYENNRRLNDAAVAAVARSLEQFGFRQPIVVDADGVIIVGHTRWKTARGYGPDGAELPGLAINDTAQERNPAAGAGVGVGAGEEG